MLFYLQANPKTMYRKADLYLCESCVFLIVCKSSPTRYINKLIHKQKSRIFIGRRIDMRRLDREYQTGRHKVDRIDDFTILPFMLNIDHIIRFHKKSQFFHFFDRCDLSKNLISFSQKSSNLFINRIFEIVVLMLFSDSNLFLHSDILTRVGQLRLLTGCIGYRYIGYFYSGYRFG